MGSYMLLNLSLGCGYQCSRTTSSQQLLKSPLDMWVYKTKIEKQNTVEYISYLRIFTLLENTTNFMLGWWGFLFFFLSLIA